MLSPSHCFHCHYCIFRFPTEDLAVLYCFDCVDYIACFSLSLFFHVVLVHIQLLHIVIIYRMTTTFEHDPPLGYFFYSSIDRTFPLVVLFVLPLPPFVNYGLPIGWDHIILTNCARLSLNNDPLSPPLPTNFHCVVRVFV
jgi:hypothetical protein